MSPPNEPPARALTEAEIADLDARALLLEDQVRELEDELAATRTERDALRAETSRALRTPLTTILGYTEMLIEEAEERGVAGFIPDLQKIRAACDDLLELAGGTPVPPDPAAEDTTPLAGRRE